MNYVERRDDIVWAFAGLVTVLCLALWLGQGSGEQALGLVVTTVLVGLVVLTMSHLNVRSDEQELSVNLGAGFFRRKIQRESIVQVAIVPPPSAFGVGLRLLPDGWLYSLGVVEAFVEVRLTDGSRLLIGSSDPEGLADQLHNFASR